MPGDGICHDILYSVAIDAVTVSIANGGTGQITQSLALTALLGTDAVPVANGGTGVKVASFQRPIQPQQSQRHNERNGGDDGPRRNGHYHSPYQRKTVGGRYGYGGE